MPLNDVKFEIVLVAGIAALLISLIQASATLFGVPPPTHRDIARLVYETVIAVPTGGLVAYVSADWLAHWASGVIGHGVVVHPLATAVVIGFYAIKIIRFSGDVGLEMLAQALRKRIGG